MYRHEWNHWRGCSFLLLMCLCDGFGCNNPITAGFSIVQCWHVPQTFWIILKAEVPRKLIVSEAQWGCCYFSGEWILLRWILSTDNLEGVFLWFSLKGCQKRRKTRCFLRLPMCCSASWLRSYSKRNTMCPQISRYWASDIMSVGRSTRIKNSAATTSLNHNRDPRAVVNLSGDCCAWTWNRRSPYLKCLDHVRMPRLWSFTPIWMEVGAIWGCWDGKKVAATGGTSSWWDKNVQNSKHWKVPKSYMLCFGMH